MEVDFNWLKSWKDNRDEICAAIAQRKAYLKIVLKTKNEVDFFDRWLNHHSRIVGLENIIIFDNQSDQAELSERYRRFAEVGILARYAQFHNMIHQVEYFAELYHALRESCQYFIFLDTDEFLVWLEDGHSFINDARVVEKLQGYGDQRVIPGVWLSNADGYPDRFWLGHNRHVLLNGLRWGKPIISATAPLQGVVNHNCQIANAEFPEDKYLGFFVLHLNRLYVHQRIRANMNKLVSRKILPAGQPPSVVLTLNSADYEDGNAKYYIDEIKSLIPLKEFSADLDGPLRGGTIRLHPDGLIHYHDEEQRELLTNFQSTPASYLRQIYDT